MDLRNSLAATFGVELPATVVYDHPTITALAAHISKLLSKLPKQVPLPTLPSCLCTQCAEPMLHMHSVTLHALKAFTVHLRALFTCV